jgi:hypothetical protein
MHAIRVPVRAVAAVAVVAVLAAGGILAAATVVSAAPQPKPDPANLSISNKVIAHGKHQTQFEPVFAGDPTYRGSHRNVITVRPVK